MRAEPAVSASGTGAKPSLRSVLRHCPSACVWRQRLLDREQRGVRQRHQLMAHAQEMLADDVQSRVRQQVMDVRHPPGHRVLDRDHGVAGVATLHRRQRILERGAGDRLADPETPRGTPGASWHRARPGRRRACQPARLRSMSAARCALAGAAGVLILRSAMGSVRVRGCGGSLCRQASRADGRAQGRREYRRRAEPCQRASRRCACRPRARAAARAARASRAWRAAARRSARAPSGDTHRCRCDDRAGRRRTGRWRA